MIELYQEGDQPQALLDGMKLHLLKKKQTNSWKTSKATAAACYAFLLDAEHWLADTASLDVRFTQSGDVALPTPKTSTGYQKITLAPEEMTQDKQHLMITNPNEGVAWGGVYVQYFEDLDKITHSVDEPVQLAKSLYKVGVDNNGDVAIPLDAGETLSPGDRLRVRIEMTVDRPMEFMVLKDMRSSGLEPVNVLSQYKWQDGLGYYESTRDVATYFYFERIPKGNFVFEYDVRAAHAGEFSNGIVQLQSMYAPEFSSHSEGVSLRIVK